MAGFENRYRSLPKTAPGVSYEDLCMICTSRFPAPTYDLTRDENTHTVWIRKEGTAHSVGLQAGWAQRVGVEAALAKTEMKLKS